jgi:hypothetical protein
MVDDVEDILREIAERVKAEQAMAPTSRSNGEDAAGQITAAALQEPNESPLKPSLARLESYLTTTSRAWDRLPPVFSYRSGAVARFELWIKRILKRFTRWYTWEQVNFNAAVDHSLRDAVSALSNLQEQVLRLRSETLALAKRAEQIDALLQTTRSEIDFQRKDLDYALEHHRSAETQQQKLDLHVALQLEALTAQLEARVRELTSELRQSNENLLQEQRVSFKQLSLEISETGTGVERSRREIQTRLQKLEKLSDKL